MRKLYLALAAIVALGVTVPLISTQAEAQGATVVVKERGDRPHYRSNRKVTVIKHSNRPRHYSERRRDKVVIVKKRTPRPAVVIRAN